MEKFCRENTVWSFLLRLKSSGLSLPRSALVAAMIRDNDLTRFISSLLQTALQHSCVHRALIGFHSGVFLEYTTQIKAIDEGVVAFLIPAFIEPLKSGNKDYVVRLLNVLSFLLIHKLKK